MSCFSVPFEGVIAGPDELCCIAHPPWYAEWQKPVNKKTNKEPPQLHHQIQCDRVSDLGSEKEISGLINVCRCGGSVLSCIFTNQIIMLYILGTYN